MTSAVSSKTAASLVAIVAIALPAVAHAQDKAENLFEQGRTLLDQRRYDEACPKLAESQRIEPGAGTLVALALCHEGQGKTATAHRELEEATAMAKQKGRDDLAGAAAKKASAMEGSLSKLVVRVRDTDVDVRCDGEGIVAGKTFAVDPGEHRIEATSKGKIARTYVVRLSAAGVTEIVVEPLETPVAATPPKPPIVVLASEPPPAGDASPQSNGTAQRIIGLTIVAAGVGGLGTGAYFGAKAIGASSDARRQTGQESTDSHDRAKRAFTSAIVSAAAGTGALTLGLVLFATAPKATPKTTARIVPTGGPGDVGLGMAGIF